MTRVFTVLILSLFLLWPLGVRADDDSAEYDSYDLGRLTAQQIERVKVCKRLLQDVDPKSVEETVSDLESNPYPEENLQILEAVAKTYDDIVREKSVVEMRHKNGLYEMITMNMAYLQLGGVNSGTGTREPLYHLIQKKLKQYLPLDLLKHSGIFQPIDEE